MSCFPDTVQCDQNTLLVNLKDCNFHEAVHKQRTRNISIFVLVVRFEIEFTIGSGSNFCSCRLSSSASFGALENKLCLLTGWMFLRAQQASDAYVFSYRKTVNPLPLTACAVARTPRCYCCVKIEIVALRLFLCTFLFVSIVSSRFRSYDDRSSFSKPMEFIFGCVRATKVCGYFRVSHKI